MAIHDLNANGCVLSQSMCAYLRQQLAPEVKWKSSQERFSEYLLFPEIEISDAVPVGEVWMTDMAGNIIAKITNIGEPHAS